MEDVSYQSRPNLRRPVLVAAFEGWNDAAESATGAVQYLETEWEAQPFASLDPEPYFDFQAHRPHVRLTEEGIREVVWPSTEFTHASIPSTERDAVLLRGVEPSMRWPTFTRGILDVCRTCGVELVITLGALLAGRPHTRPVRVTGVASTPELSERYGLSTPRYEGPTGIVGVLMDAARREDLPAIGLWAWVPHYVQHNPSPTAALSIVQRLSALLGFSMDLSGLAMRAQRYEERLDEAMRADPEIVATVQELERQADEEEIGQIPSGEELAAEVERFLREQPPER